MHIRRKKGLDNNQKKAEVVTDKCRELLFCNDILAKKFGYDVKYILKYLMSKVLNKLVWYQLLQNFAIKF